MSAVAKRVLSSLFLVVALATASHALAAAKKDKDKEKDAPAKPSLVATYGDWSVYQGQSGKNRICYALATPKERAPDDLKRDPGYAFISERPSERVRNEVSFVMGFELGGDAKPPKDAKEAKDKKKSEKKSKSEVEGPTAVIGDSSFDLLPKGSNLWVKNPAEESQLIDVMRKGAQLKIHAPSKKGAATVDSYSLTGFSQAIDSALKDCPGS
jgi:hypothetical protein